MVFNDILEEVDDKVRESFYHYILTERNTVKPTALSKLARYIAADGMFPKTSTDYDEISRYLETHVNYVESMTLFDEAWQRYMDKKQTQ